MIHPPLSPDIDPEVKPGVLILGGLGASDVAGMEIALQFMQ